MRAIGITGGVACGKTLVTDFLVRQGYTVIDADQIIATLYKKKKILDEIDRHFQTTDKEQLRELIFTRPQAREILESILHPKVLDQIKRELKKHIQKDFVFVSIPLLFEKTLQTMFDHTLAVVCDQETQTKRLMKRDQLTHEQATLMISSQWPNERKKELADDVIENNRGKKEAEKKVNQWLKKIKAL